MTLLHKEKLESRSSPSFYKSVGRRGTCALTVLGQKQPGKQAEGALLTLRGSAELEGLLELCSTD